MHAEIEFLVSGGTSAPRAATSGLIRSWREDDATALVRHANDRDVWRNMRDAFPHPYRLEDGRAFIELARKLEPLRFFAIVVNQEPVGGIGYTRHEDIERIGAEVGYWLGRRYWSRGIMTAALRAFTAFVFDREPEVRRLYAVPLAWNPASARVLERAGYRLEGRLRQSAIKEGTVVDQLLYAVLRDEAEQQGT